MDEEELFNIIALGEGQKIEFKESLSKELKKEIKFTICAFSNTEGGKILVGVRDDGTIKGIDVDNKIISQVQQLGRQIDPHLKLYISIVNNVLIIEVFESNEVHSVNGMYFMRYGTDTQKLVTDEVRGLFELKNKISFEEKINEEFDFKEDFNEMAYDNFLTLSNLSLDFPIDNLLENMSLLKNRKLNNAGILFFCKNIYKFFRNATVQVFLYKGKSESSILDNKEFNEDIYSNFKNVLDYLILKLNTEFVIDKTFRKEVLEIPEVAIREALLNAFSHRDYNSNANIQVHIYWDRIEIINGGGLPNQLKIEDLGKRRFPRNILICDIFQRMNLVEKAGSGIKRIKDSIKEKGLRNIDIESDNFYFKIIFWRSVVTGKSEIFKNVGANVGANVGTNVGKLKKVDRQQLILKTIVNNLGYFSQRTFAKEVGVNPKTIERDLKNLNDVIYYDQKKGIWKVR